MFESDTAQNELGRRGFLSGGMAQFLNFGMEKHLESANERKIDEHVKSLTDEYMQDFAKSESQRARERRANTIEEVTQKTPLFTWIQRERTITLQLDLKENLFVADRPRMHQLTAKDYVVDLKRDSLSVGLRKRADQPGDQEEYVFFYAKFPRPIKVSDSTWSLVDRSVLEFTLDKDTALYADGRPFWDCLRENDSQCRPDMRAVHKAYDAKKRMDELAVERTPEERQIREAELKLEAYGYIFSFFWFVWLWLPVTNVLFFWPVTGGDPLSILPDNLRFDTLLWYWDRDTFDGHYWHRQHSRDFGWGDTAAWFLSFKGLYLLAMVLVNIFMFQYFTEVRKRVHWGWPAAAFALSFVSCTLSCLFRRTISWAYLPVLFSLSINHHMFTFFIRYLIPHLWRRARRTVRRIFRSKPNAARQ